MKCLRYKKILVLSALGMVLSSCADKDFCLVNGYVENTPAFESCQARYRANSDEYRYCKKQFGIVTEGAALEQCVKDAQIVRHLFEKEKHQCNADAYLYYPDGLHKTTEGNQFTSTQGGKQVTYTKTVEEEVSKKTLRELRRNHTKACMERLGWKSSYSWVEGKF